MYRETIKTPERTIKEKTPPSSYRLRSMSESGQRDGGLPPDKCHPLCCGGCQPKPANMERRSSFMKVGHHLAVPSGKRTKSGDKASSISTPHVIALVGLPARGKTYISKKLSRYLNWIGINTKVFNLGDYRRKLQECYSNHEFFSSKNEEGVRLRERVCEEGLQDVIHWLEFEKGEVAVFDATNTTRARRRLLFEKIVKGKGFKLFFVESVCDNEDIIDSNIKEVKVMSPDYKQYDSEQVVKDFRERIRHYEKAYEPLEEKLEKDYSFMKLYNVGEKILVHKIDGHIQSRIVYYLMNVHITPRTIYLTRHGESTNNLKGLLGGDSDLTQKGIEYGQNLAEFIHKLEGDNPNFKIWTSWMKRTIQTAKPIKGTQERWKTLDELDAGICDELTYEEIASKYPKEFMERDLDKFMYRYPRGESYEDVIARLEPVIMEMERQDSILVVCHQAVIRCLIGYYQMIDADDIPWLDVPLHTIIKLEPIAYGCRREDIFLGPLTVSTYRPKPPVPGFLEERFRYKEHLGKGKEIIEEEEINGGAIPEVTTPDPVFE